MSLSSAREERLRRVNRPGGNPYDQLLLGSFMEWHTTERTKSAMEFAHWRWEVVATILYAAETAPV